MSVEHLSLVLNHSQATGTAKLVLLGIANHAGDGGAWPSLRTLARYANVDPRNVRMALRRLEDMGELRVHLQAGGLEHLPDYRRPNRYEVCVSCPEWCDRSPLHRDLRVTNSALWEGSLPGLHPRTQASPAPRTQASPAPRTQASPKPSVEPPQEPACEPRGSGIHASHGGSGWSPEPDSLHPPGLTDPLWRE